MLHITLVALLKLAAPGTNSDTVEVTFHCPLGGQLYSINWDSERKGYYTENGKSNDITFSGGGFSYVPSYSFQRISRSGQKISCEYRGGQNWTAMYSYTVNRQVYSCLPPQSAALKCKLNDSHGK